jgi:hypothetical protein
MRRSPPADRYGHRPPGQHAGAGGGNLGGDHAKGLAGRPGKRAADLEHDGGHQAKGDQERASRPGQSDLVEHVVDLELQREAAQRTDRQPRGQGGGEDPRWPLRAEMEQQEHQSASHGQQSRRGKAAARQRTVPHLAQRVTGAGQRTHQQHEVEEIGPQGHIGTTARAR